MNLKACVLLSAVLYASPVLATPIVSVAPRAGDPTVVGQQFRVDVSVADVTDLFGFQFDLEFDQTLLSPFSIEPGSALDQSDPSLIFFTGLQDTTVTPGKIAFVIGALFDPPVGSDGVLATFRFDAIGAGTTSLTLSNVLLQDLASFPDALPDVRVDLPGSVTITAPTDVTPVPEPATMLLLGTGLAVALRKHRARPSNK